MSEIIQLYTDKEKSKKAYPKTLASEAYMSTTETIVDTQHSNDNVKKVFIQEYR